MKKERENKPMLKQDLVTIATIPHRENKAKAYSKKVNKVNKRNRNLAIIAITSVLFLLCLIPEKEYVYATKNGYVTEVKTKITSVDVDINKVYITYKGKEYSYFAEGKIATQGKITVKFDSQMRIIDAY